MIKFYKFTEQNLINTFYKNALFSTIDKIILIYDNGLNKIEYKWFSTKCFLEYKTEIYYRYENFETEIGALIQYLMTVQIESIREFEDKNNLKRIEITIN